MTDLGRSGVPRGPVPDPARVDWQAAYRALVEACMTVPMEQHDRTPEQQAAVERFTTRLVQAGELLAGPELGMMNLPLEDGCSALEFLRDPGKRQVGAEALRAAAQRVDELGRLLTGISPRFSAHHIDEEAAREITTKALREIADPDDGQPWLAGFLAGLFIGVEAAR